MISPISGDEEIIASLPTSSGRIQLRPGALGQPTQLHVPYPSQPDVSRASNGCGERAREMGRQLAAGQNGTLAGARASCQKIPNFPDDPLQDGDVVA